MTGRSVNAGSSVTRYYSRNRYRYSAGRVRFARLALTYFRGIWQSLDSEDHKTSFFTSLLPFSGAIFEWWISSRFTPITMKDQIRTVAVIGCGVIGASWACLFLSRGLNVLIYDPAESAWETFENYLQDAWPALAARSPIEDAWAKNYKFIDNMELSLSEADFIQEVAPAFLTCYARDIGFANVLLERTRAPRVEAGAHGKTGPVYQTRCHNLLFIFWPPCIEVHWKMPERPQSHPSWPSIQSTTSSPPGGSCPSPGHQRYHHICGPSLLPVSREDAHPAPPRSPRVRSQSSAGCDQQRSIQPYQPRHCLRQGSRHGNDIRSGPSMGVDRSVCYKFVGWGRRAEWVCPAC